MPRGEVGRDHRLLPILPAADVEQVVRAGLEPGSDGHRLQREAVTAGGRAAFEHRDVPAIGIDVQVLGVEVAHAQDHGAPSQ